MKKNVLALFGIAILMVFSCGETNTVEKKPGMLKDGPFPRSLGKIVFFEDGTGQFCPCSGLDCMSLTGEIQFKGLRSTWHMMKANDPDKDLYGELSGYYFTTTSGKGVKTATLDLEHVNLQGALEGCNGVK